MKGENETVENIKRCHTVAIMQPYIFPYIGYFQLINAADVFVLYDDVNYIKQGWINRNKVLNNNEAFLFTIPVEAASSYKKINETGINVKLFKSWSRKFEKLLATNYKQSRYFDEIFTVVEQTLNKNYSTIGELNCTAIKTVCEYLDIATKLKTSTGKYDNEHLSGQDRVIDISLQENAEIYLNASGGRALYDKEAFAKHAINLHFIAPELKTYAQLNQTFVPGLSIIDVLMFNGKEGANEMLRDYSIE
jgi:hypothetical protein